MHLYKYFADVALVVIAACALSACSSDSNGFTGSAQVGGGGELPAGTADIRILHAVADAPSVNIFINDSAEITNFEFRSGTRLIGIDPGNYDVRVEAITPEPAADLPVINVSDLPIDPDTRTTIIAAGLAANDSITPLLIPEATDAIESGKIRLQVVHAAAGVGEVSVFLTGPDDDIGASNPLDSFTFGNTIGPAQFDEGAYRVRVAAGAVQTITDADVVYDSGTLNLSAGADLMIVAVNNTVTGTAPVSLVVLDGLGSGDVFDAKTGAALRVVHNSPDADPVDVVVDDLGTVADENLTIVSDLAYGEVQGYLNPVDATDYSVDVVDASSKSRVFGFDTSLQEGIFYTVIANNVANSIEEWVVTDDRRSIFTEARLRLFHGSPAAGLVDIYFLPAGILPSAANPDFSDIQFGLETGFVPLVPGNYDIYVTPANQPLSLDISVLGLSLNNGGVYTAIARDNPGGGFPLGLTLLDDFLP